MTNPRPYIKAAMLLLAMQTSSPSPIANSSPIHEVFEVVNEQARIDDKRVQANPGFLPYGNPLAGNSKQNAKLHAQNQQAMFNAERVRQHRAQLQRLNKGPTQTDSYMRAYHESQENHQIALEKQQANLRDRPATPASRSAPTRDRPVTPSSRTAPARSSARTPTRQRQTLKRTRGPDFAKIMQEEAALQDNNRNHRSYGSVQYQQYLEPKQKYKTVYITAGPTYDQGVTIKPNGNVGVTPLQETEQESAQLFTRAVPSDTKYIYPKQYSQMHQYESAQDIASLNALLKRDPETQLSQLNALIESDKQTHKELETPLDLYFYLKDPSLAQHYAHSMYTQTPETYASGHSVYHQTHEHHHVKDHTPITEEIDDIEDPNKNVKRPFTPQPTQTTIKTTEHVHYYAVDPTVATNPEYYLNVEQKHEALKHEKPLTFYSQDIRQEDHSERYLHHNAQHTGIQHLNEDGTGVSAYGDDDLHYAANYEFGYRVRDHHTGNDFGHSEAKRDGNTDGHYHVLLPDGRMQNVKYRAGPDGYHADITYHHLQASKK